MLSELVRIKDKSPDFPERGGNGSKMDKRTLKGMDMENGNLDENRQSLEHERLKAVQRLAFSRQTARFRAGEWVKNGILERKESFIT